MASGIGNAAVNAFSFISIAPMNADLRTVASLSPDAGSLYELSVFSADSSQQSVDVTLTFNGVTSVTPLPTAYDVTSGKGWFNPAPIKSAVNYNAAKSGYKFMPAPQYKFGTNGDFGYISRLMISQQPILTLNYQTDNFALYEKTFEQQTMWKVSLLGNPLGGSQSGYSLQTTYNSISETATVTMVPVTPTDQLAHVIGGELNWLGA